ncbi:hypothetical protein AB0T83_11900 [Fluviibacterium sp. DFM31]|uniref:Uncharacterized protein n=1 Tax=Meridianimarinicoccus marinus TaxID=3231483 RepID=A0ABV3L7L8_9RHOB
MSIVSETAGRIRQLSRELEIIRSDLSAALAQPEASGGISDVERARLVDLHRRVTNALSSLH